MKLSDTQRHIVEATDQNILFLSTSGCGKTTILTKRIERLINAGIDPKLIVAFTFTNEAANEMKVRLEGKADGAYIGTIHGYAAFICGRGGVDVGKLIVQEKFDDIITEAYKVNLAYYPYVEHLLLDEVQDLDENQFKFVTNIPANNRFYVGDFRQQIYGFNLTNPNFLLDFLTQSAFFTTYSLNECYRCPQNIINYAEEYIRSYLIEKQLPSGKAVYVKKPAFISDKFSFSSVLEYITSEVDPNDYKDWAILCRSNAEVDYVCEKLKDKYIPYCKIKRDRFHYEQAAENLDANKIKVMTCHSSKGLTFPRVVVMGINAYNEEEGKVAYVAITRAQKEVYICDVPVGFKKWSQNKKKAEQTKKDEGMVFF